MKVVITVAHVGSQYVNVVSTERRVALVEPRLTDHYMCYFLILLPGQRGPFDLANFKLASH